MRALLLIVGFVLLMLCVAWVMAGRGKRDIPPPECQGMSECIMTCEKAEKQRQGVPDPVYEDDVEGIRALEQVIDACFDACGLDECMRAAGVPEPEGETP